MVKDIRPGNHGYAWPDDLTDVEGTSASPLQTV